MRTLILVALVVAVVGWLFRDHLRAPVAAVRAKVAPAVSTPPAQDAPDVLYTWVDKDGVTHYEQQAPGKGRAVAYDGNRLTPVAPVDPDLAGRIREAAGAGDEAMAGDATGAPGQGGEPAGSASLHGLRQELQEGARRMQEAKAARHPDL